MKYIEREITEKLLELSREIPVLFLTGPKQSGKTTLLKNAFSKSHDYVSLEEKEIKSFALNDPKGFLKNFKKNAIIDDIQNAPNLPLYISEILKNNTELDSDELKNNYILSGSRTPAVMENARLLLGNIKAFSILPFSVNELASAGRLSNNSNDWLLTGNYPKLISTGMNPEDFFNFYIDTFIEKNLPVIFKIHDSVKFKKFLSVLATSAGSPLNFSKLGAEVSIDARTVGSWLSILEEAYIIFRLNPYDKNGKRYVKTAKVYFYDSGLLCVLLGIKQSDDFNLHRMRGRIFESAVIAEIVKKYFNRKQKPKLYFWRDLDNREKEIDLIELIGPAKKNQGYLELTEIRASQTPSKDYLKNLLDFNPQGFPMVKSKRVIYEGDNTGISGIEYLNWKSMGGNL